MDKCPYAEILHIRFKNYFGRIGGHCDACKLECIHSPVKIGDVGMSNGYAFQQCSGDTTFVSSNPEKINSGASGEANAGEKTEVR